MAFRAGRRRLGGRARISCCIPHFLVLRTRDSDRSRRRSRRQRMRRDDGTRFHPSASQAFVSLACLVHLVSATFFVTLVYLGTRRITGSRLGSFALTLVLLLPSVTDGNSFVSDLLRNIPGVAFVENPIHAFVAFQSVDWQRWLGGEAPHLWFLPLVSMLLPAIVYGLSNRQGVPWR